MAFALSAFVHLVEWIGSLQCRPAGRRHTFFVFFRVRIAISAAASWPDAQIYLCACSHRRFSRPVRFMCAVRVAPRERAGSECAGRIECSLISLMSNAWAISLQARARIIVLAIARANYASRATFDFLWASLSSCGLLL